MRAPVMSLNIASPKTAVTDAGQRTQRMLARTLGLPIFGTLNTHILVEASALTCSLGAPQNG